MTDERADDGGENVRQVPEVQHFFTHFLLPKYTKRYFWSRLGYPILKRKDSLHIPKILDGDGGWPSFFHGWGKGWELHS